MYKDQTDDNFEMSWKM